MKKLLLTSLALATSISMQAQSGIVEMPLVSNSYSIDTPMAPNQNRAGNPSSISAGGDTIWYEDFANGIPSAWSLSGANTSDCPWKHSYVGSSGFYNGNTGGSASPMSSATASNGFLLCDPDSANDSMFGQPSGSTYQYLESYITTSAIDLSGQPAIRLEFEQSFRYNNTIDLEVAISTDSVNWTTFDAKGNIAPNAASPDPMKFSVDVSAIAGGSSTVYVRIGWSARVYFWMIDDIRFITPPANDLALDQVRPRGYADSTMQWYYSMVPVRQADAESLTYGSIINNLGSANQTNVVVNTTVDKDGTTVFTGASTPMTIAAGAIDSADATSAFTPSGTGVYTVTHQVSSDSTDADSTNNVLSSSFEVSLNEYRWDNDNVSSGNWYNADNTWEMAISYEFPAADTILGISAMFPDLTNGYGIDAGDPISYYVYDVDLNQIASNEFYIVQAEDENGWLTLPVYAELTPGIYYVSFKIYTPESAIGSNATLNSQVAPFSVLVNVDGSTQWSYTTSLRPFIRAITKNSAICDNVIVSATGIVTDNQETGSIDLTPAGGTAPYSYSWTGPNGYASTDQNLTGLLEQGTYTVVVTDLNGCVSDPIDFTVAGIVSTNDAAFNSKINVYPNPNNGVFNLNMSQVEGGGYSIRTTNILGATVNVQNVEVNGSFQTEMNMTDFGKGIYFVEVSNEFGQAATFKVIVK